MGWEQDRDFESLLSIRRYPTAVLNISQEAGSKFASGDLFLLDCLICKTNRRRLGLQENESGWLKTGTEKFNCLFDIGDELLLRLTLLAYTWPTPRP